MDNSPTSRPRSIGELDPTFADKGIFTFSEAIYGFELFGIGKATTAQDRKILIPAINLTQPLRLAAYLVARLNEDGTPDQNFGTNGAVSGRFTAEGESFGASVAITQEGKIILSGYHTTKALTPCRPALAGYLSTGQLDESFGENGIVHLDFLIPPSVTDTGNDTEQPKGGPPDKQPHAYSFSITPLPNGKLVFCGMLEPTRGFLASRRSILGRLNPDGSLDHSFASKGYLDLVGNPNTADSHVVQPDGKILVCGQIEKEHTIIYVRRYLENGTPDPTFTFSEQPLRPGILDGGHITAIALHEDGRIIIGANKYYNDSAAPWNGVLMCLTSSGAWDSGFNGGKPVEMALGASSFRCTLKDILIDGDGVILLGDMGNIALTRYFLDGTPDAGFGNKPGWWEYSGNESYYLVRQDDGKILATAMSIDYQWFVARFLGE
ncbi:delta-60 repeat domain-containing protein [Pseudomonas sp. DSP3-2-2]|uniref:delta-60 repeat domain-containing protein n=1 Tax=unclassified Pseudomonas TaxID=196821 RepID=UPI003CE8D228